MARRAKSNGRRDRLVLLLSAFLVVFGAIVAGFAVTGSRAVMVHRAHQPSRAEMIREWRALLEKDGRSLPDHASVNEYACHSGCLGQGAHAAVEAL